MMPEETNKLSYVWQEGLENPHELILHMGSYRDYMFDSFRLQSVIDHTLLTGKVEEREDVSYTAYMFENKADAMLIKMLYDPDAVHDGLISVGPAGW